MRSPTPVFLLLLASSFSIQAQVTDVPPSTPSGLTARAYSGTAGGVAWLRSTDDYGVQGYEITRDDELVGLLDTLSIVEFDLAPGTTYRYGITAVDNIGQRSDTAYIDLSTNTGSELPVPTAPQGLQGSVYSSTAAEIFWTRPATSVSQFEISQDGVVVATTEGISYFTTGLSSGTTYEFQVVAIDSQGARSTASTVELTTQGGVTATGPNAPQNLAASVYSSTAAELFWTRSSETGLQYEVRRDGGVLATISGVSYFDNTLQAGTSYQYEVVTIDNEGGLSAPASIELNTPDDGGSTPPVVDDKPYLEPDPNGTTYIARAGYSAARDLTDDLVSTSYLSLYFDVHSTVDSMLRSAAYAADNYGDETSYECTKGGTADGQVFYQSFDVVFNDCQVEGVTLNGSVNSEVQYFVFGSGDSQIYSKTFDDLNVDAGALGSLSLNGTSVITDRIVAENTALCSGAPTITQSVVNQLNEVVWQADGERLAFTNVNWMQTAKSYPAYVEERSPCKYVDTLVVDGSVEVSSTAFGQESQVVNLSKQVDIKRDSGSDPSYSGSASLAGDFGDGSSLTLTASADTDGEVQVDIVDGNAAVSFVDEYLFEARDDLTDSSED